jgi:hypothetical protein
MRHAVLLAWTAALLGVVACAKHKEPLPSATTAPSAQTGLVKYQNPGGGFALEYPSDWQRKQTNEYVLALEKDSALVTVDVPPVPPHLPGMMTMKAVVNGYEDDLKKRLSGFSVLEDTSATLAGAKAQHLVMSGSERAGERKGNQRKLAALVAIHNERVYILQADASPEAFDPAQQAMQQMADSWHWTK